MSISYTGKKGRAIQQKILDGDKYVNPMEGLYNIKDTKLLESIKNKYFINYTGCMTICGSENLYFNSLQEIIRNINKLNFLKNYDPNIIIAGGSLLSLLVFDNNNFSDIDVYFRKNFDRKLIEKIFKNYLISYGTERAITLMNLIDKNITNIFENESIKHNFVDKKETIKYLSDYLKYYVYSNQSDNMEHLNYMNKNLVCMNRFTEAIEPDKKDILCNKPLQIIKMPVDSPSKLLHLFDMPLCQICYYMDEIYVTEAWIMSYFTKKNIICYKKSENFKKRFIKYNQKKKIPFLFLNFNAQFVDNNYLLEYNDKKRSKYLTKEYTTIISIKNYFTTDKERTGVYNIFEHDKSIDGILGNNIKSIFTSIYSQVPNNLYFRKKQIKMEKFKREQKKESIYSVFSKHVTLSDILQILQKYILKDIGIIITEYLNYPQSFYRNILFTTIRYPNIREIRPMLLLKKENFKDTISYHYTKSESFEERKKIKYPNLFTLNLTFLQQQFLKYRKIKNETNFLNKILIKDEHKKYSFIYKKLVILIKTSNNKTVTSLNMTITELCKDNKNFIIIDDIKNTINNKICLVINNKNIHSYNEVDLVYTIDESKRKNAYNRTSQEIELCSCYYLREELLLLLEY